MITWQSPTTSVDWENVEFVRVTLETAHKDGGLRWRQGTSNAKRNTNYNAHDPSSGPPYWPGTPTMYPEDAPAIAGDPLRNSFIMPAQAAYTAFGYFYAPREVPRGGIDGFTIGAERTRVASFWSWYKMPSGDGTMHPPMNRIGPPDVPDVSITPLSKNMTPLKDEQGDPVSLRVREFWQLDEMSQYDVPNQAASPAATAGLAKMLEGFTQDEVEGLRDLLRAKAKNGQAKV